MENFNKENNIYHRNQLEVPSVLELGKKKYDPSQAKSNLIIY